MKKFVFIYGFIAVQCGALLQAANKCDSNKCDSHCCDCSKKNMKKSDKEQNKNEGAQSAESESANAFDKTKQKSQKTQDCSHDDDAKAPGQLETPDSSDSDEDRL
jgi:hypothetical protein